MTRCGGGPDALFIKCTCAQRQFHLRQYSVLSERELRQIYL